MAKISSLIRHEFDPFELAGVDKSELPTSVKIEIADEVADYVAEQILSNVAAQRSPVSGRKFKRLSDDYKDRKEAAGLPGKANLEAEGDLLDALVSQRIPGDHTVEVGVSPSQEDKADGHNNFTGNSPLPKRQFIPDEGQQFKPEIRDGVKEIVRKLVDEYKSQ